MKFKAHYLEAAGSWKTIEAPGPESLEVWRDCWAVFKPAAILAEVAPPYVLDNS